MTTDADEAAEGFEDEKTSPQVVRHQRVQRAAEEANPIAVVCVQEAARRRRLVELLWADGWNAVEAKEPDELYELCRSLGPHLALLEPGPLADRGSLADGLRAIRPGALTRVVALLDAPSSAAIAGALADGFDDFVSDRDNDVEILARATANLRSARNVGEIHKQRRDAALLLELSQTLASSLDMQLILHTVSRLIAEVIELERCSIVLLDPERDDAIMVAASEDRTVKDLRIKLSNYPELKRCVESGAPVLIDDAQSEPLLLGVQKSIAEKGVRTMALFPIVFEERVTGVLFLRSSKSARRLADSEIQFGQTVASACAVAIRNARLFDQYKDQNERINSMRMLAERQTEALRKYQDFFEYAADGMAIIDGDGRVLYVNKEGRRLLGRTRDDLLQLTFQDLILEESRGRWADVVDQVRHGRFKRSFDVLVARGDGNERVFSLSAGGGGQETGLLIVSFRDVTETREMEGELRTTKEFLENLIDNSVDAIVASDMNGNVMLFNKGAEKIYGFKAEDVIGRVHVSQLYPAGAAAEVMAKLREERFGGRGRLEAHRREILNVSGEVVPVSMTASLIYEDGDEVATVGVFTDLRERMAVERQLNEAKDLLSKTEKARVAAELAGMAAHELNQPLTSVLGYAEMLKNRVPEADERLRRPVDTIFRQAERMAEIVRKIGRITKYETRRYGLNVDMIDLDRASEGQERDAEDDSADITNDQMTPPRGGAPSPRPDEVVTVPPVQASAPPSGPRDAAGIARALAAPPKAAVAGADPRAAIVRLDTIEEAGYERRLREQERKKAEVSGRVAGIALPDESTQRFAASPGPPQKPALPAVPSRPVPRAIAAAGQLSPDLDDDRDHTNPGVKMSDLKKPR
ncbi:MAG: PAS domain S-box protein [Deltaproteobacteria bacterium]|nr:PAS domain S-box protein [Deltaproteobacteria bacterium]